MFRVSIIHMRIIWASRDQVSSHSRPRLLHAFSPVTTETSWFTLEPLHTTTVVYISLKKEKDGYENKYQGPVGGGRSRYLGACKSHTKPLRLLFYRLIYF